MQRRKLLTLIIVLILLTLWIYTVQAGTGADTGLWNTPKPKFHHDQFNTGRSVYTGPTAQPPITWIFDPKTHIPGLGSNVAGTPPALLAPDGAVYYYLTSDVGGHDFIIVAVNPDGTLQGYYPIDTMDPCEFVFTPLTIGADGTFYFASAQNTYSIGCTDNHNPARLYAVAADGSLKWRLPISDTLMSTAPINIAPDGTIYVAGYGGPTLNNDGLLMAVADRGSYGEVKWQTILRLPGHYALGSPNAITVGDDGHIYVGGKWGLIAVNSDGDILWQNDTLPHGRINAPVFDPARHVLYTASSKKVYAVDPDTGNVLWDVSVSGAGTDDTTVALGPDGTIYVTKSGDYQGKTHPYLCAVDPAGTLKWCQKVVTWSDYPQMGSPISDAAGNVYALAANATLVGFAPNGALLFRFHDYSYVIDFTDCAAWDGENEVTVASCGGLYVVGTDGKLVFLSNPNSTDVRVDQSVSDATPQVGDTVTFTITVKNQGLYATHTVNATDPLPDGLPYMASTATQGMYDPQSGTWTIGSLTPGATVTLTLNARVDTAYPVTNTVTVHLDECDYATLNNVKDVTVTPQYVPASIGDRVWYDENRNGVQDAGEVGIPNVAAELYDNDTCAGTPIATTATNSDGMYEFTDLVPGTYSVKVIPPAGFALTFAHQGDDTLDSDMDLISGCSGAISLNSGMDDMTRDAGVYGVGRIGDQVWSDTNGNGIQDADETQGIPGTPLHVTGVNVLHHTLDITVTASVTGYYAVRYLPPGTYTVTAPASFGGFVRTSSSPVSTVLGDGHMVDTTLDFGYIAPTSVQLVQFNATPEGAQVFLRWAVHIQGEEPRFRVWRSTGKGGPRLLTPMWVTAVERVGAQLMYEYVDTETHPGEMYVYQLEDDQGIFYGPWSVRVPREGTDTRVAHKCFIPHITQ